MRMTILLILGIICLIGAVILVILAFLPRKKTSTPLPETKSEPLPGGSYVLAVEGMHCAHCQETVEDALNAFEGVTAKADCETGTVQIHYDGCPDLGLLDALKQAVEEAGYSVKEIE